MAAIKKSIYLLSTHLLPCLLLYYIIVLNKYYYYYYSIAANINVNTSHIRLRTYITCPGVARMIIAGGGIFFWSVLLSKYLIFMKQNSSKLNAAMGRRGLCGDFSRALYARARYVYTREGIHAATRNFL